MDFLASLSFLYHLTFSSMEKARRCRVSVPVLRIRETGSSSLVMIWATLRWTLPSISSLVGPKRS